MEPSNRDREIWIDGALVPWESATVHLLSHSDTAARNTAIVRDDVRGTT